MKRLLALVLTVALSCLSLPAFATQDDRPTDNNPLVGSGEYARTLNDLLQAGDYTEGRVLARVTDEFAPRATYSNDAAWSTSDLYSFASNPTAATARTRALAPADRVVLIESSTLTTAELLQSLADTPGVLLAQPDYVYQREEPTVVPAPEALPASAAPTQATTNDPLLEDQWQLTSTNSAPGATNARELWSQKDVLNTKLPEVVVAVIDTGVDYTNPDLADVMWENPGNIGLEGEHGYDVADHDPDPMDDFDGHGTHVAGIIAARANNHEGGAGVAPNAKIMALRADSGEGFLDSNVIAAYSYIKTAVEREERVVAINNSWGSEASSILMSNVIDDLYQNYGVVSICASGNTTTNNDLVLDFPSYSPSEGVISVNAVDRQGSLTSFSSYGAMSTDIAAPGDSILSTYLEPLGMMEVENSKLTLLSDGFESNSGIFSLSAGGSANPSVERIEDEGAGEASAGGSIRWIFEGAHAGQVAELVLSSAPGEIQHALEAMGKTPDDIRYLALNAKVTDSLQSNYSRLLRVFVASSDKDNPWIEITPETNYYARYGTWETAVAPLSDDARRVIDWENLSIKFTRTLVASDEGQRVEFEMDDVSLLAGLSPYKYLSGTSMATPVVTGAYALMAGLFPTEKPSEWRARILGGVVRSDELAGTCTSDGSLDLMRAATNPYPVVDALEMTHDGSLSATVRGSWFGENPGRVLLDGEELKVSSWTPHTIAIELPASLSSQMRYVQVVRSDGETGRRSVLVSTQEEFASYENLPVPCLEDFGLMVLSQDTNWQLASAGGKLYATTNNLQRSSTNEWFYGLLVFDPQTRTWSVDETLDRAGVKDFLLTSYNNSLYLLETEPFKLYRYDPVTQTLSDSLDCDAALRALGYDSQLPLSGSLACDGQFVGILGSVDGNRVPSGQITLLDITTGQVTSLPSSLQARSAPAACFVDGELFVMAGNESGSAGSLVNSFERLQNGAWVSAPLPSSITPYQSGSAAMAFLPAGASIAGVSTPYERVVLAGLTTEDLSGSDTYVYDPAADTWQALPERLSASKISLMNGVVSGDAFYVLGQDTMTHETVFRRLSFERAPGEQSSAGEEGETEPLLPPSPLAPTGDPTAGAIFALALAALASAAVSVFTLRRKEYREG